MITSTDFSITGLNNSKKITFLLDKNNQAQVESIKKCYHSIVGTNNDKAQDDGISELCVKIKLYSEGFEVLATVGVNEEIQKKIGSSKFPYSLLKIVVIIIHFESELRRQLNIRLYYKIAGLCLTSLIATSSDNFMEEIMERAQEIFIIFNKINHNKISKSGFEFILHFFQILSTLSKSYANKKKLFLSFSNKLLEHAIQALATLTTIISNNNGNTSSSNKLSILRDVLDDLIQSSLFQDDKHVLELSQVALITIQQNKLKEEEEISSLSPSNHQTLSSTPPTTTSSSSNSQKKRKLKDDSVSIQSFYSSFYSAIIHMKLMQQQQQQHHQATFPLYPLTATTASTSTKVAFGIGYVFQLYIQKSKSILLHDSQSVSSNASNSNDASTASMNRLKHYCRLLRVAFCLIQCCSSPLFGDFMTPTATASTSSTTGISANQSNNNSSSSVSNESVNNDKSQLKKKKRKLNQDITSTTTSCTLSATDLPMNAATTLANNTNTATLITHIITLQCINAILNELNIALSDAGSLPTHNDVIRSLLQQLAHLGEQSVMYLYHSAQDGFSDNKDSGGRVGDSSSCNNCDCEQIVSQCFEMITLLLNIDHRSIISWESNSSSNSNSSNSISNYSTINNIKESKKPSLRRLLLAIAHGSASASPSAGDDDEDDDDDEDTALKTSTVAGTPSESRSSSYSLLLLDKDDDANAKSRCSEKLLHKLCTVYWSLSKMYVIIKECLMTSIYIESPSKDGDEDGVVVVDVVEKVSCDQILGTLLQLPGIQSQLLQSLNGLPTPQILLCWEAVEEYMSCLSSYTTSNLGATSYTLSALMTPLVNASYKQCWSMPMTTINTLFDMAVTTYQINQRNMSVVQVITLLLQFGSLAVSYATESKLNDDDDDHCNPDNKVPSDSTSDAMVTIDTSTTSNQNVDRETNMDDDDSDSYNEDEEENVEEEEEEEYNEDDVDEGGQETEPHQVVEEEEVEEVEVEEEEEEEYNEVEESSVIVMKESNRDDVEEEDSGERGSHCNNLSTMSSGASPSASMPDNPTKIIAMVNDDDFSHWNHFNSIVNSLLTFLSRVPDDNQHGRNSNNSDNGDTTQTQITQRQLVETSQFVLLLESCHYLANYNANEYFTRCTTTAGITTAEKKVVTPLTVSKILMIFWKSLQSRVSAIKTNHQGSSSNQDEILWLFSIILRYESVWKSEKSYRVQANNSYHNDDDVTTEIDNGNSIEESKGELRELQDQVCSELLVLWIHQQLLHSPLLSKITSHPVDNHNNDDDPTTTIMTDAIVTKPSNFLFQMISNHSTEFEFLTATLFSELLKITKDLHQAMVRSTTSTTTPTNRVTTTSNPTTTTSSLEVVLRQVEGVLLLGFQCVQSWNSSIRYSSKHTRYSIYQYMIEVITLTSSLLTQFPPMKDTDSGTDKMTKSSSFDSHSVSRDSDAKDIPSLACTLCQSLLVRYTSIYSISAASTSTSSSTSWQFDVLTALERLFHSLLTHLFTSTGIGSVTIDDRIAIFDIFYFITDSIITQSLLLLSTTSTKTVTIIEIQQVETILLDILQAIIPYTSPLHLRHRTTILNNGNIGNVIISDNHKVANSTTIITNGNINNSEHIVKLVTVLCNSICKHLQGLKISPALIEKISLLFNHIIIDHHSFWDAHFLSIQSNGNSNDNDRDNSRILPNSHNNKNHNEYNMSIGSSYFITADITRTLSFLKSIENQHLCIPPLFHGATTTTTTATTTTINSNGWLYLTGIICMLLRHQKLTLAVPTSMTLINQIDFLFFQEKSQLREEIVEMFIYQLLYTLPTYCHEVFINRIIMTLIRTLHLNHSDSSSDDSSNRNMVLLLAICEGILQTERRKEVLFVQVICSALESIANEFHYEEKVFGIGDVPSCTINGSRKKNSSNRNIFKKVLSLMKKAMVNVFVGQEKKIRNNKSNKSYMKEDGNVDVIKASIENGSNSNGSSKGSVDVLSLWATSNLYILSELARKLNTTVTTRSSFGKFISCNWTFEACSLMLGVLEQLLGLPVALLGPSVGVIGNLLQLLLSVLIRTYPELDAHSQPPFLPGEAGVAAALRQGARTIAAVASSKELTKHCPQVAAAIIDGFSSSSSSGGNAFSAEVKELLMPGLFALFDRCQQRQRKQLFALLDAQGAALLQDLYGIYLRDYKFVGKS